MGQVIELLGLVFGGFLRLVPEGLKLWDRQKERLHERDMLELRMKADEARASAERQAAELQGNIQMNSDELRAIIEATRAQAAPVAMTGNRWLDAILVLAETLSKTVRPVLTYWYCVAMYGAYKIALFVLLTDKGFDAANAVVQLWKSEDQAIVMSIISFWFVDRVLRKQNRE